MLDGSRIRKYNDSENGKEGIEITGDVVRLNVPEVLLSPDVNLPTESRELITILNELFNEEGEGGDDDDWQPPDDWLKVPEPDSQDIYYLVEVTDETYNSLEIYVCNPYTGSSGCGIVTVDWGDENSQIYEGYECDDDGYVIKGFAYDNIVHSYSQTGQFIIHVITDRFNSVSTGCLGTPTNIGILICKSGENIRYTKNDGSYIRYPAWGFRMHYFKHLGDSTLPTSCFMNCYSLRKVEFANPITVIPSSCFMNCHMLQYIDLSQVIEIQYGGMAYMYGTRLAKINMPKCISIGDNAFLYGCGFKEFDLPVCKNIGASAFESNYILTKINAPECENVGISAFASNYNLKDVSFAENTVFGNGCFSRCYNLYPRPDGSVN